MDPAQQVLVADLLKKGRMVARHVLGPGGTELAAAKGSRDRVRVCDGSWAEWGVGLDTVKQIQSQLEQYSYEGFLR